MAYIHKLRANGLALYLISDKPARPKGVNQSLGIPEWLGAAPGRNIDDRLAGIEYRRDVKEEEPEPQAEESQKKAYSISQHMRVIARYMEMNQ